MREQLRRLLPLVALELPSLTRSEDCNYTRPIFGLELLGCVDYDEADGAGGVDRGNEALNVQDVG